MKVIVDAQVDPGFDGGIDTYLLGLLHGLDQTRIPGEEIIAITSRKGAEYFRVAGSAFQIHAVADPLAPSRSWKDLLGAARRPLGRAYRRIRGLKEASQDFDPVSDGLWESLAPSVVHQTYPLHWKSTACASVLTMHDLQHRHFPAYFDATHLQWRESVYPQALAQSQVIVTISEFVRQDIVEQYGVPAEKILVAYNAPWRLAAAPEEAFQRSLRSRYALPDRFMIYPGMLIGNKNHAALLQAVALLRDRSGLRVSILCPGRKKALWPDLAAQSKRLGLEEQVRFLDFLPRQDLEALLHMAEALVFPSVFEGAGIPVVEAFSVGLPVFCSDIPAFREYGGAAAHFFDPHDPDSIARSLERAWEDEVYRAQLAQAGLERAQAFSWAQSASVYRMAYQMAAGRELSASLTETQ